LERDREPPRSPLGDTIDLAVRRIMTSIVVAGAIVGIAVYASGGDEAPRYQVTAGDGRVIRVNTDSGTVIACEGARLEHCAIVLRRGQDLDEDLPPRALPGHPAPPALPAVPAPGAEAAPPAPTAPALPAPGNEAAPPAKGD
jgi:hypothetical protein